MRLIFAPTITVIGETTMHSSGVKEWISDIGMGEALKPGTTLSNLLSNDTVSPMELLIEFAGRMCYRSYFKGRNTKEYLANIIEMGHGSVLEHSTINFAIAGVSRSFTHELVRHRVGTAISQESQRYVDASDINFVVPHLMKQTLLNDEMARRDFEDQCRHHLDNYRDIQDKLKVMAEQYGLSGRMLTKRINEAAREVLPNMVETRMVWTVNLRELRHVLLLRGNEAADLQFMQVSQYLLWLFQRNTTHLASDFVSVRSKVSTDFPDSIELVTPMVNEG